MKKAFLKAGFLLLVLVHTVASFAQTATTATGTQSTQGETQSFFYDKMFGTMLLIVAAVVILVALLTMYRLLNAMIKVQQLQIYQEKGLEAFLEEAKKPRESFWQRLSKRWTKAVPVEQEHEVLFAHDYDGIRELDNKLPPWWVALFYVTIAFAAVYMSYYHFFGKGPSSTEQYQAEIQKAEEEVAAFRSQQADQISEETVTALTGEADLSVGQTIFQTNCVVCHGAGGEGGVGPNLTDPYWIHGGGIKNVFKTIVYGVPEKGMISWKDQLRSSEIQKVASFILTLQGTNPANAKEPQGDLYQGDTTNQSVTPDTTAAQPQGSVGMK